MWGRIGAKPQFKVHNEAGAYNKVGEVKGEKLRKGYLRVGVPLLEGDSRLFLLNNHDIFIDYGCNSKNLYVESGINFDFVAELEGL